MSEQSSEAHRKRIRRIEHREEAVQQQRPPSQLFQGLGLTFPGPQSRFQESLLQEALSQNPSSGVSPKGIVENLLRHGTVGQFESSSSSSSVLHQPHLQMILRQPKRRLQAETEQQPSAQTNAPYSGTSQRSHAEQLLFRVHPGDTDIQMSQQSHMQKAEFLSRQTSQHSTQNPHDTPLFTELLRHVNHYTQPSDGSQQQNIQGFQQLLLQLLQQIPTLSVEQPLQTQPLFVQVLPSSSVPLQQLSSSKPNQPPVLPATQQSAVPPTDRMPPLQQSPQLFQQPDQATSSVLLKIPRETQLDLNQPSTSSESLIFQRIQETLQQSLSQQQMPRAMGTDSHATSLLAELTQTTLQQSNLQQVAQESRRAHLIFREAVGSPPQSSESSVQSSQQSSQAVHNSFEIPDVSLLDLPQREFIRVIRQHPYKVPLSRRNSMKSTSAAVRSREVSFKSLRHHSGTKFVHKSIPEPSPEPPAQTLSTEPFQQSSVLQGNQTRESLPGNSEFSTDKDTSQVPDDTVVGSVSSGDELHHTLLDDDPEDDETTFVEVGTEDLISSTETSTASRILLKPRLSESPEEVVRRPLVTTLSGSSEEMDRKSLEAALSRSSEEMDRKSSETALSGSGNLQKPDEAMTGNGSDSATVGIAESAGEVVRNITDSDEFLSRVVRDHLAAIQASLEWLQGMSGLQQNLLELLF